MKTLQIFNVAPNIPEKIQFLEKLSQNLWWTWNSNAKNLFRRINPELWYQCDRNPIALLSLTNQERLLELSEDEGFLNHLGEVKQQFKEEIWNDNRTSANGDCMSYFSLEYGLHESLRTYSGGLGVLAGDHLKTASDMDLCLIGVGLFYREGYFRQHLNKDGWQEESYPPNLLQHMPLKRAKDKQGKEVTISIQLPEGTVQAIVWLARVGKTDLFLLDTNIAENRPEYRDITSQLYGGDRKNRLRQELILGIGGFNALLQMGYEPKICHINEGHAAFLNIARLNHFMESKKLSFDEALWITQRTKIFTTHTPVPAGHESFKLDLLKPHLEAVMKNFTITFEEVMKLAQIPVSSDRNDEEAELSMTILGLRTSAYSNGVSRLHGKISRDMWKHLWPDLATEEIPIKYITNGVHLATWASEEIIRLMERYIGQGWDKTLLNGGEMKSIDGILPEELWNAHETAKSRMIATIRKRTRDALKSKNAPAHEIERAENALDNDTLTIGFARRFASYKRATLLLRDLERFKKLITNDKQPIQIIFAGKAHPQDNKGKELIQEIYHLTHDEALSKRVVFIEDYDMFIAERLVQGVDIWLNTPRRPREASGTSGMKAALNGVLNCSILDGWWDEAYDGTNGWAIGSGEIYSDHGYQDHVESQNIYHLLEDEIIPLYYQNREGQIPHKWVTMMKQSIKTIIAHFSSYRMVKEYRDYAYIPAYENSEKLSAEDCKKCRELNTNFASLKEKWNQLKIQKPTTNKDLNVLRVGEDFTISVEVFLGEMDPDLVKIEVYYGSVTALNKIEKSSTREMQLENNRKSEYNLYTCTITCESAGRYGFSVRIVPRDPVWKNAMPGLVKWTEV